MPKWSRTDKVIATAFVVATIITIVFAALVASIDSR
jgi:hypothetical protein